MTGDPETLHRILQTKAPAVSNLFQSLVVKRPVFNVSIPILQGDQVRYVMSLGLLPDDLRALLQSQELGSEWVTLIWDTNGVILACSRENLRHVGTRLPQNLREHAARGVVRTANLDGANVLHATARSRVAGWGVGVNVSYSLFTRQVRISLLLWAGTGLLAIAIALAAGLFFARQITGSLSVAAKAAAAFGRGDQFPLTGSRLTEADAFLVTLKNAQQAREELMKELAASERRSRTIHDSISDAFFLLDKEWRFRQMNPTAEKLMGLSAADLIGKVHWEQYPATLGTQVEILYRKAAAENIPVHFENYYQPWDRWFDIAAYPSSEGLAIYFRDITERKRAQAALLRLNEDLRHFTFAATHDLREPLRMVTIHAQMLERNLKGQVAEEASLHLKQVVDGAQRISRLVDGLLEFSRVGETETRQTARVDTEAAFEEALGNLTIAIGEAKRVITHEPLPLVSADQTLVCRLFQNLLGNAVKYHCAGVPPRIHVSV
jgi:PAS domain S-box-containing protein